MVQGGGGLGNRTRDILTAIAMEDLDEAAPVPSRGSEAVAGAGTGAAPAAGGALGTDDARVVARAVERFAGDPRVALRLRSVGADAV